mgnify:FL=1
MKRIYRISIFATVLFASVDRAVAQELRTAYFVEDFKWRHDMNPAFGNRQSYVALPFSNINVGLQGSFGVDNFLFENPRWGQPGEKRTVTFMHPDITYDQSVGKLKNGLKIQLDFRETIIGMGFKAFHGYNTLDVNVKGMAGVSFPKSFLEFAKRVHNDTYSFDDMAARGMAYGEVALGHSHQINNQLRIGARLKGLVGLGRFDFSLKNAYAKLEGDVWEVRAQAQAEVNAKGFAFVTEKEEYKSVSRQGKTYDKVTDVDVDDYEPMGGFGLGIDLGATYEVMPGLTLSASLTDLGFIKWKSKAEAKTSEAYFSFDGFHEVAVDGDYGSSLDDELDDYEDQLADFMNLAVTNDAGSSTHALAATMNLGAEYQMPFYKGLSAGLLLSRHFNGSNFSWTEARLSGNLSASKSFSVAVSYALNTFGSSLGYVVYYHPKVINFFFGMDRLAFSKYTVYEGFPVPLSPNFNFVMGLSVAIGGGKNALQW